jgi:hypothetical protein
MKTIECAAKCVWAFPIIFGLWGCSEVELSQVGKQLDVSPALSDVGTVAVGDTLEFFLQLDSIMGGNISVNYVEVLNVEGDFFLDASMLPAVVDRIDGMKLGLIYAPQDEGYHRAVVTISSEAENSPIQVDVRGAALSPEAVITPAGIDYGMVDVGTYVIEMVTVRNNGELPFSLTTAQFSNGVFSLGLELPLEVASGQEVTLPVVFEPENEEPEQGTIALRIGQMELPAVSLRGNDCEGGLPVAYDVDGDGYTSCAGDCDDDNPYVHPGTPEEPDGVDQDCDDLIDEGTIYYDDDGDGYCEGPMCTDETIPGDCNDGASDSDLDGVMDGTLISPGVDEILGNGVDDDCDGVVDLGTSDLDGDGYSGDLGGDCNDNDPNIHPGMVELPNFIDDDCDGIVDEETVNYDDDGDGYCESTTICANSEWLPGDCDDDTSDMNADGIPDGSTTYPNAEEIPDWRDNDCDGDVDEWTVNSDDDGDGYTENGGDCNDNDDLVSPAMGNCP